jgi:hypothetical protein
MKQEVKDRLFIVGCPRSGTTLLQSLLAAHEEITSFPETHFFQYLIGYGWRRRVGLMLLKRKRALNIFLNNIGREDMKKNIPKFIFRKSACVSQFVDILDNLTIKKGKKIWIEKTPIHLHYIKTIEKYVPNSKFIHIVRSGKDVVASLYDVTHKYPKEWGGKRGIDTCINRCNEDFNITKSNINKENHIIIKFDELLKNNESVLMRLCNFIGVKYNEELLKKHGDESEKLILRNEEWKNSVTKGIKDSTKDKFNILFTENEKKYIINNLNSLNL